MNFLDSLKDLKKQMKDEQIRMENEKKELEEKQKQEQMQKVFLKEEKLLNEFEEYIKNSDIKKI